MSVTNCTGYGIKLAWGPGISENSKSGDDGIGFSERAYSHWKCSLPVGTRMLIYETSKDGGRMSIVSELEVIGCFSDGAHLREHNPEHTRMLPVRVLQTSENLTPVRLPRIREVLENDKWPHQGLSWQPVSSEIYETLLAELRGEGKSE